MNSDMALLRDAWLAHWSEPSDRHFNRLVEVYIPLVRRVVEECLAGQGPVEESIIACVPCLRESIVEIGYDPDRVFADGCCDRIGAAVRARMAGRPTRGVVDIDGRQFESLCRALPAAWAGRAKPGPASSAGGSPGRAAAVPSLTPGQRERLRAFIATGLSRSERLILAGFAEGMTPVQTRIVMWLSQPRVERVLNATLDRLRAELDGPGPGGAGVAAKLPPNRPGGAGRAGGDDLRVWE